MDSDWKDCSVYNAANKICELSRKNIYIAVIKKVVISSNLKRNQNVQIVRNNR